MEILTARITVKEATAIVGAYWALTRYGNATAVNGVWDEYIDRAHHYLGLLIAFMATGRITLEHEIYETAEQFTAAYAARSGVTPAMLRHMGRYAEPCDCKEIICDKWQMGHQHEDALAVNAARDML